MSKRSNVLEAAVDEVLDNLRSSGATLAEVRAAVTGVRDALFTKRRSDFLFWFAPFCYFLMLCLAMAILGVNPNDFNRLPFYASPLYYLVGSNAIMEAAASNALWAGMAFSLLIIGSAAVFRVSLRDRRSSTMEMKRASTFIAIFFCLLDCSLASVGC